MENPYSIQQKQIVAQLEKLSAKNEPKATLVDMQKDYKNDDQICLTSLSFVEKKTADKITEKIIKPLEKSGPDHFYFPADSMHITIKNIRTIHKPPLFTPEDIIKADKLFKSIIPKFPSFSFNFKGLAKFPTSISLIGYCDETLRKLVQALDRGLNEISLPDNKKYISDEIFFGNISICRFTHEPSDKFIDKFTELKKINIGTVLIKKINLITCNAVCNPKTRNIINTYELKNEQTRY
ncbi:hypothetical protein KKF29_02065 [Patescibacteria group bacterium]|nr:hypothetical protein [Patescibacteria group bacterium]